MTSNLNKGRHLLFRGFQEAKEMLYYFYQRGKAYVVGKVTVAKFIRL
jgi:hypothetical protein